MENYKKKLIYIMYLNLKNHLNIEFHLDCYINIYNYDMLIFGLENLK